MKTRFLYYYITFISLFYTGATAQYIQVNDTYTAQQLVDALVAGSCAQVSNISINGWTGGAGGPSFGYFTDNGSGFPFANGVILSTGFAASAPGPNDSLLSQGNNSWGGDPDLEAALGVSGSVNATILEFDFVPITNSISFDYIFASEQYLTSISSPNQCNYTDGFAFLLKEAGSTAPYQNLAVVPGTDIPVKVNTVRGQGVCPAANESYFGGFNPNDAPINFNGQTVILTAQASVVAGTTYHIKLVVADQGNGLYDSAIFLGGGSFQVGTDLGADRLIATGNPVCDGGSLTLDATTPNATNYRWFANGVLQASGPSAATFNVAAPGTYSVEVELNGSCFAQDSIIIEYASAIPSSAQTLLQCDYNNDGLTTFNVGLADALVNTDPNNTVEYYTSLPAANAGGPGSINKIAYGNTSPNQQIYARVQNQFGCYSVSTVTLATSNNTVADPAPLEACDDDGNEDGFYTFDLTPAAQEILQNLPPNLQLQYFETYTQALATTPAIANPTAYTNTTPYNQTIYARIYNGSECYGIAEIELVVFTFGNALQDETVILCTNNTITLNPGVYNTYSWNTTPPVATPTLTVAQPGVYTVTVTNANGCPGTKTYTVVPSGPATGADIAVNDFAGNNNSITVTPVGPGNYAYSIDGINYQPSPVFYDLNTGEYTIYIKDINGCGAPYTDTVFVLDYPRFFTPNGDGENDYWRIPFLQFRSDAEITIFDRFGKLIRRLRGVEGWDGTYSGIKLPSTDYWFVLKFNNGRIIKGHFSMLR